MRQKILKVMDEQVVLQTKRCKATKGRGKKKIRCPRGVEALGYCMFHATRFRTGMDLEEMPPDYDDTVERLGAENVK